MEIKDIFKARLEKHWDELKWLYCELYENRMDSFQELVGILETYGLSREEGLRKLDQKREQSPDWYRKNDLVGMMLYVDAFAKDLKGLQKKLPYLKECGVNYLHLMPLLESPKGKSDGGYAVSDFRKVQPSLGTMEDLKKLCGECHRQNISICLDFVMNHTSEDHHWARKARAGEKAYQDRYFFFDDDTIPRIYESTCPQVFPTTAPGNFTWLPDAGKYVMTTFYPYQWDLNYRNPKVFNAMTDNLLNLANQGVDIIRIDAVPYIWKTLGTSCRNLPQVHTIVRMLRMICEIVCPGVLLLGEVVMEPEKVAPYFGTLEKPECHMLYNVTTMATTWHTVATKDVSLLQEQLRIVSGLPTDYLFLNYLRCHDDIGWGLSYPWLQRKGMEENPHKRFLNDYFTGKFPGSDARGELYNDDPASGDARLCGTTASLCGLEAAKERGDAAGTDRAIGLDLMLHAFMLSLSGIPVIYSGDEIGQLNDYSYKEDPDKCADSRYVHRGAFPWRRAALRNRKGTAPEQLFHGITRMEEIRRAHPVFVSGAGVSVPDTGNPSVLCLVREAEGERLTAFYNFSPDPQQISLPEEQAGTELLSGKQALAGSLELPPYGAMWILKR